MNISNSPLPPIYTRNNRSCYLDPIRQKLIYITPEETVRQKVISYLLNTLHVPADMITVEEPLSHYGLNTRDRADIIVSAVRQNHRTGEKQTDANQTDGRKQTEEDKTELAIIPIAVIECKAESVYLDEKAFNQAQKYSDSLGCVYTTLINGIDCFCFKYDKARNEHVRIETLLTYKEMLQGKYQMMEEPPVPKRVPFERLEEVLIAELKDAQENGYDGDISPHTRMSLALPIFNLWEAWLDVSEKMPADDYGMFRLIEDYGVRMLSYGNGSGGVFFGPYRSFLVEVNGNTEFYSLNIATYWKSGWDLKEKPPKTCINVAHDDEKSSHHALQLVVDENCVVNDDDVRFYHHGRIGIGRIGSGKKSDLLRVVKERYPQIVDGERYYLGKVKADHLLRLSEPDVKNLIINLISYSIVRDEYREMVKREKA